MAPKPKTTPPGTIPAVWDATSLSELVLNVLNELRGICETDQSYDNALEELAPNKSTLQLMVLLTAQRLGIDPWRSENAAPRVFSELWKHRKDIIEIEGMAIAQEVSAQQMLDQILAKATAATQQADIDASTLSRMTDYVVGAISDFAESEEGYQSMLRGLAPNREALELIVLLTVRRTGVDPRTSKWTAQEVLIEVQRHGSEIVELEELTQRSKAQHMLDQALADINPAPTLQELPGHAKDVKSMPVESQQIIDQARAAAQQPEHATHPEPDIPATLTAITAEAAELQRMRADLQEQRIPLTDVEAKRTIAGLGDIATRSSDAARQLGLHAIKQRILSQAEVGELLGVSQKTVSRWYREHTGDTADEPQK